MSSIRISLLHSCSPAGLAAVAALAVFALGTPPAEAATRSMTGALYVKAPSANIEGGIGVYGRKVGGVGPVTYAPTDSWKTVDAAGTTPGTFVGRGLALDAGELAISGMIFNDFPPFSNVGQLSRSFMSPIEAATFAENGGALADCPGPGCTAAGAGTAISWCPPIAHNPTAPAPGTVGAPIGNWDCPSWPAGAGGGDRFMRIGISNSSGRAQFGGTFQLLRNFSQNVWRILVQPSTPNAPDAEATRTFMFVTDKPWTPGGPNWGYQTGPVNKGPRVFARLNGNGAVQSTFGCTNGVGTPGGSFMQGMPRPNLGNNCGTNTIAGAGVQAWGFRMTTGTISGSDPYPFGLVVTTVGGTPFNPNFGTQPASQGFFFSRMGTDAVAGSNRNLVLLGGAVAVDPDSGNAFFRIMDLQMNLQVPEPTTSLGLLAGAGALIAFARRRRA